MNNESGGFTLVEMLVVISILSIMLGMGVGIHSNIASYRFAAFTQEVAELVQSTQQIATRQKVSYSLKMQKRDGVTTFELHDGTNAQKKVLAVPTQVTMKVTTEGELIQFNGDMSPSKAATICMKHKKLGKEVHLTVRVATGKITFYEDKKC